MSQTGPYVLSLTFNPTRLPSWFRDEPDRNRKALFVDEILTSKPDDYDNDEPASTRSPWCSAPASPQSVPDATPGRRLVDAIHAALRESDAKTVLTSGEIVSLVTHGVIPSRFEGVAVVSEAARESTLSSDNKPSYHGIVVKARQTMTISIVTDVSGDDKRRHHSENIVWLLQAVLGDRFVVKIVSS